MPRIFVIQNSPIGQLRAVAPADHGRGDFTVVVRRGSHRWPEAEKHGFHSIKFVVRSKARYSHRSLCSTLHPIPESADRFSVRLQPDLCSIEIDPACRGRGRFSRVGGDFRGDGLGGGGRRTAGRAMTAVPVKLPALIRASRAAHLTAAKVTPGPVLSAATDALRQKNSVEHFRAHRTIMVITSPAHQALVSVLLAALVPCSMYLALRLAPSREYGRLAPPRALYPSMDAAARMERLRFGKPFGVHRNRRAVSPISLLVERFARQPVSRWRSLDACTTPAPDFRGLDFFSTPGLATSIGNRVARDRLRSMAN